MVLTPSRKTDREPPIFKEIPIFGKLSVPWFDALVFLAGVCVPYWYILSWLACLSWTSALLSRRIRHIACIRVALSKWHGRLSNMLIRNQGQLALRGHDQHVETLPKPRTDLRTAQTAHVVSSWLEQIPKAPRVQCRVWHWPCFARIGFCFQESVHHLLVPCRQAQTDHPQRQNENTSVFVLL